MMPRTALLQVFVSIRSKRLLMEQINYNLAASLARWLPLDADVGAIC